MAAGSMLAYGTEAVTLALIRRVMLCIRAQWKLTEVHLLALIRRVMLCIRAQWKLTEVHLLAREMARLANIQPQ